ncbi:MAG: LuxR C-terminal-related transcriptional regulator, partial [Pirellulaceae bacterium]
QQELLDAIRMAFQQGRIARRRKIAVSKLELLTADEREVLDMIIKGVPSRVIAHKQHVSVRTIENRRHHIYEKTQTHSIAQLVRMVVESQDLSESVQD